MGAARVLGGNIQELQQVREGALASRRHAATQYIIYCSAVVNCFLADPAGDRQRSGAKI